MLGSSGELDGVCLLTAESLSGSGGQLIRTYCMVLGRRKRLQMSSRCVGKDGKFSTGAVEAYESRRNYGEPRAAVSVAVWLLGSPYKNGLITRQRRVEQCRW